MVVVAVKYLNVYTGFRHPPGEFPELSWNILFQPLNKNISYGEHADSSTFKRPAGGATVSDQKMRGASLANHPRTSAFDAYAGACQGLAHLGECSRTILQIYL